MLTEGFLNYSRQVTQKLNTLCISPWFLSIALVIVLPKHSVTAPRHHLGKV